MKTIECLDGFTQVYACVNGSVEPAAGYQPDPGDVLCDWSENGYIPQSEELPSAFTLDADGALAREQGGFRRGSGRKRLVHPLQTISVTLYASQVERLNATGNASKALREILK